MTSKERHEIRYQNRVNKRKQAKIKRAEEIGDFDQLFSYNNLFVSAKKCCNGIRWKTSIQNFESHRFSKSAVACRKLKNGKYKLSKYNHFVISERGKIREIEAPAIKDKPMQKILSQDILRPLYEPIMVYNNGASQKNKGTNFSRKLLCDDMRNFYQLYGKTGYVILIDFKGFFPNAAHWVIKDRHKELLTDKRIIDVADMIVDSVPSGMPLGIEPSQFEMIAYPSKLDNYIKSQLSIKNFGRYMDDYYLLVPPDRDPKEILQAIFKKAECLEMQFNHSKTRIIPFGKSFTYCKIKYRIDNNGKIIKRGNRKNIKIARRKLFTFKRKYIQHEISLLSIWDSVQSTLAYFDRVNNHNDKLKYCRLFYSLFGFSCENFNNFKKEEANG